MRLGLGGLAINRGGKMAAYTSFIQGVGGNRGAPILANGDNSVTSATAIAGEFTRRFRIPVLPDKKCANGDILLFVEGNAANSSDWNVHTIFQYRSSDNGNTWTGPTVVYRDPSFSGGVEWLNLGAAVIDSATGKIFMFFTQTSGGVAGDPATDAGIAIMLTTSTDNGLTWSAPEDHSNNGAGKILKKQSGLTAPFDSLNETWGWCIPTGGWQIRNGANAGRIVFAGDHRYEDTATGTSWSHFWFADSPYTSWTLAGVTESVAANQGSNECGVAEYGSSGHLYANSRKVGSTDRLYTVSTDGGATWADMQVDAGLSGGAECKHALTATPNGDLYAVGPADSAIRSSGKIWKSTDGGASWTGRLVSPMPFGYSALLPVDGTSLLCVFEGTKNVQSVRTLVPWYQYIVQRRIPTSWVTSTAESNFLYSHWLFNEATSGAIPTVGNVIKDHGNQQSDARGGAYGTYTATGFSASGTGIAATLAELIEDSSGTDATSGNACDPGTGDWTCEIADFKMTDATVATKTLINSRGTTGAGVNIAIAGSHRASFLVSDGVNSASVFSTAGTNLDDGVTRDLAWTYTASSQTCKVYINGVLFTTGTAGSNIGSIVGDQAAGCVVGANTAGGAPAIFTCSSIRITKGLRTSFLTGAETKTTLAQYYGYTPTVPATGPQAIEAASLKMYVGAVEDGGYYGSIDRYGAWNKGALPYRNGQGITGYRDIALGKLFDFGASENRGAYHDSDSTIGKHWRLSYEGGATGFFQITSANQAAAYDFVHATGVWSFCCAVKFVSVAGGGTQTIIDNCSNSTANPGFGIYRTDANTIYIRVSDGLGGAPAKYTINNSFAAATAVGTWYFLGVTGDATNVKMYLKAYPGSQVAPTLDVALSAAYATTGAGAGASTQALGIGCYGNGAAANADIRIKNVALWNVALTAADMQNLCNHMVLY